MAKKRVHEIAKERGMSSKDVIAKLQAAGLDVKVAASSIEESAALKALGANGSAPAAKAAAANGAGKPASATPKKAPAAAKPATSGAKPAPAGSKPAPGAKPATPSAKPATAATSAPAGAAPPAAQGPASPSAAAAAPAASAAPAAPAAAPAADGAPPAPRQPERPGAPPAGGGPRVIARPPGSPPPGTGPKIISQPEKPKRDESAAAKAGQRPTRTEAGAAGGRRRVVIDSQAARRGPGGPGGPGGGPNQGPPRRQRRGRRRRGTYDDTIQPLDVQAQAATDLVKINSGSTVKDVAEYLGVPIPEVIKKLMTLGEMATLTQTLSDDAIQIIADAFEKKIEIVHVGEEDDAEEAFDDADSDLVERPPVVTIMGHVDHGKTSLLDAIRQADVVGGEAGGITQHIGAYQVHHAEKVVTFLDTPGHEAFTAMRARGARVTDIAIIVVAADDGVKPQTEEAIDHALAAEVPILVAVNKVDKEGADPTRVRTEMTQKGLQPVEWGGEIEFVDVSAKSKTGLEDLLETINVMAEIEELRANPGAEASGVVIESKLDPGRGPVVTVLIQRGTLKVTDALVAGSHWGKVRAMHDYTGGRVKAAGPGDPVEILGFDGVPDAGDTVRVVENDKRARVLAAERGNRLKTESLARRSGRKISLEDVFKRASAGEVKELNLVLKADVSGSLEAFEDEIAKLPQDEVFVNVIHSGVGGVSESDVMLAAASEAVILGFNVRPVGEARPMADREGIEIRSYAVIYRAIDELRLAMQGMLDPEEVEDTVGSVEIRTTFRASRVGTIAGSYVTEGKVVRGGRVRVVRDGTVVNETTINSLKRFNDDVREVLAGFECGIVLDNFQDIKEGDVLEAYDTRKVERELV